MENFFTLTHIISQKELAFLPQKLKYERVASVIHGKKEDLIAEAIEKNNLSDDLHYNLNASKQIFPLKTREEYRNNQGELIIAIEEDWLIRKLHPCNDEEVRIELRVYYP